LPIVNLLFLKIIIAQNGPSRRTQHAARRIIQRRNIINRRHLKRYFNHGVNLRHIRDRGIQSIEQMNNGANACLI
jgi:hypothetical protein